MDGDIKDAAVIRTLFISKYLLIARGFDLLIPAAGNNESN